jgi:hypothetical protein
LLARPQWLTVAILSLVAVVSTALLSLSDHNFFQPYFGPINPLLGVLLASVLGTGALASLRAGGWFQIFMGREGLRGILLSASLATLLAVLMILFDLTAPFPRNINVPFPQSLLFYPAMAFVAEMVFHILPLSVLLVFTARAVAWLRAGPVIWSCILLVSLIEPLFQVAWASSTAPLPGAAALVGVHVLVFNLLQLYVFRRYDLVSMYAFRLIYYLHWHIVWGYLRLRILF